MTPRQLLSRFMRLPYVHKLDIAIRMHLKGHAQSDASGSHFFKEVKRRGRVDELIHEVICQELQK